MAGRSDPGDTVEFHADVIAVPDGRFPGVKAHSDPDGRLERPLVGGQSPLRLDRRPDRACRTPEDEEVGVALATELSPSMHRNCLPQHVGMLSLQIPVLICADLLDQPRGALDVGEEEGEQAHGQAASELLQWICA
jgi:hypothetical protein